MHFSIIIPVYNEENNVETLISEILKALLNADYKYEIIIINDASNDQTLKILYELFEKNKKLIKIVNNNKNLGQSFSIIKGIKESKYDTIVTIDGDGQNNPKDIPLLAKQFFLDKHLSLIGGLRVNRKDTFIKVISSKIANFIRGRILNDDCEDTGCSLKIFNKKTFLEFPEFNGIHRFLPALFKGYGKKTLFIKVDHRIRKYGVSKYGTFGRLVKGIKDMIRVYLIIRILNRNK
jgi:dolichol-phosphate mannosyltransferase